MAAVGPVSIPHVLRQTNLRPYLMSQHTTSLVQTDLRLGLREQWYFPEFWVLTYWGVNCGRKTQKQNSLFKVSSAMNYNLVKQLRFIVRY